MSSAGNSIAQVSSTNKNDANENMSLQGVTHLLHSCEERLKYLQSRYYTLIQIIGDTFQLEDVNLMLVKQLFVFTKELKEHWKAFLRKIEVLHNLKEQLDDLQVAAVENIERWSRALKEQLQGFEELLSILLYQRKAQSSAVYISGLPHLISKELLWLYFENKRRSGGGIVEEVEFMTKNLARVKFESSEDARNVSRRTHTVDGAQLEVSYRPLTEENSELSSSSRQDDVLAFLEDWWGTVMEDEITGNAAEVAFESEEGIDDVRKPSFACRSYCELYLRMADVSRPQLEKDTTSVVVSVPFECCSFTRGGSKYKALTGKRLVFWIGGRLWEVVVYEGWLHMELRLYFEQEHYTLICRLACWTRRYLWKRK